MASLKSEAVMEQLKLHMSTDAGKELTKKIELVYQINIAPKWHFDQFKGTINEWRGKYEDDEKPDATFSFTDDDFVKVATGEMNPQMEFMRDAQLRCKEVSGAQFTPDIFPEQSRM